MVLLGSLSLSLLVLLMEMAYASVVVSVSRRVIVTVIGLTAATAAFPEYGCCYYYTGFVGLAVDGIGACCKKFARRQSVHAVGWSRKVA